MNQPVSQMKKGNKVCLSYYDERAAKWKCQDECLTSANNLLCGQTPHLTNFALLLSLSW